MVVFPVWTAWPWLRRTPMWYAFHTGPSLALVPRSQRHGCVQPASRTNFATDARVSAGFTLTTTSSGRFAAGSRRCTAASWAPSIGHRFVQRESRNVSSTARPWRDARLVIRPSWSGRRTAGAGVCGSVQRRPVGPDPPDPDAAAPFESGEMARSTPSAAPATTSASTAASSAAWSTGVLASSDAVKSAAGAVWRRASSGHTYAWHENRLRPRPSVSGGGATPRRVAPWSIPLLVDGRRTRLAGWEWYATGPSPWPWLAALLVPLAAAIAAVRYGGRRLPRRLAALPVPAP